MVMGKGLTKFFDALAEILAVLTIILIAFLYLNGYFDFLADTSLVNLLWKIREYMILATIIVAGLEFAVKRSFIFFLIFAALSAVAVIFSFFPDAVSQILPTAKMLF